MAVVAAGGGAGLFGVTQNGRPKGYGTLYEMMRSGQLVVLQAFDQKDGADPVKIVRDQFGTIYGSTRTGGTGCAGNSGCGRIYPYNPSTGFFRTLYQYTAKQQSSYPYLGSVDSVGDPFDATGPVALLRCAILAAPPAVWPR